MDLFSNDCQVALPHNEHGLVAASQGSVERLATGTDFQPGLQNPNQASTLLQVRGLLPFPVMASAQRAGLGLSATAESLLTSMGQASKELSQNKAFVK